MTLPRVVAILCAVGPRLGVAALIACARVLRHDSGVPAPPDFQVVQPGLFGAPGAQPTAWADYDNDGDLDLFVGFRGRPNRLYRNDDGVFTDVAASVGVADSIETRVAA